MSLESILRRYADLIDLFEERCARYAGQLAVTCGGRHITFAELELRSRNFAAHLQHRIGTDERRRIAILMGNSVDYVMAAWGVIRSGHTLVNTNPHYTPREVRYQLADSAATVLITAGKLLAALDDALTGLGIEEVYVADIDNAVTAKAETGARNVHCLQWAMHSDMTYTRPVPFPESVALLQYTGGTTGVSKGAMLTHRNLVANSFQGWGALENVTEGKELAIVPLPLYHVYAFSWSLLAFSMHGAHLVISEDPRDFDALVAAMQSHRFTTFFGLNAIFVAILNHPGTSSIDFSQLKLTLSGGAPLLLECGARWEAVTGCVVCEGYGLTEASPVVCVSTPSCRLPGTVGRAVIDTDLKLVDDSLQDCARGQDGELCVRGPQVMLGYWRKPQESQNVLLPGGWLRTGDVASIDDRGFVRIKDRLKDVVIVSGFNVYPTEVDQIVIQHPGVLECASTGEDDPRSGQVIKLFVVRKDSNLTVQELQEHCRKQLAPYKVPRKIEFVDSLPKSAVGKVLRRELGAPK